MISKYTEQYTNKADSVYYSVIRVKSVKSKVENQMELDQSFLEYIIDIADDINILHLFPSYVHPIISKKVGNTSEGLPAFIAALMFAGTDILDPDGIFVNNVIRKLYHQENTIFYKSQQDLASFLFGISVDYVSNLL